MAHWLRYNHNGGIGIGKLEGDVLTISRGDMFDPSAATVEPHALNTVQR